MPPGRLPGIHQGLSEAPAVPPFLQVTTGRVATLEFQAYLPLSV